MDKAISEFTEIELKAIKSDMYEQAQVAQSNLNLINTELTRRANLTNNKNKNMNPENTNEVVEVVNPEGEQVVDTNTVHIPTEEVVIVEPEEQPEA